RRRQSHQGGLWRTRAYSTEQRDAYFRRRPFVAEVLQNQPQFRFSNPKSLEYQLFQLGDQLLTLAWNGREGRQLDASSGRRGSPSTKQLSRELGRVGPLRW